MICAKCCCLFTAFKKMGKHIYYYCANGKRKYDENRSYLKEDDAIKLLANAFDRLVFDDVVINLMYEANQDKTKQASNNQTYTKTKNELTRRLQIREERQTELLNLLLDKTISKDDFEAKRKTMMSEIESLNGELEKLEKQNKPLDLITLEQTKNFFLSQRAMKNMFLTANPNRQREIIKNILWNAEVKDGKIAKIKFKEPYYLLAKDPQKGSLNLRWAELDSNQRRRKASRFTVCPS